MSNKITDVGPSSRTNHTNGLVKNEITLNTNKLETVPNGLPANGVVHKPKEEKSTSKEPSMKLSLIGFSLGVLSSLMAAVSAGCAQVGIALGYSGIIVRGFRR